MHVPKLACVVARANRGGGQSKEKQKQLVLTQIDEQKELYFNDRELMEN